MRTVLNMLKDKLSTLGYNDSLINSIVSKFDLALLESHLSDDDTKENIINIEEYSEPCVEIIKLFLNISNNVFQVEVLEGDISLSSTETAVGTRMAIADYSLSKKCVLVATTTDFKVKILIYNPSQKTQNLYNGMTYEQIYKKDRDQITKEYYEAFVRNGRVTERKVKDFLTMLVSDFVIDEIAVKDANPKIKMYDNEYKYAENLYSYSLRYINLRTNRIEILEKDANIKAMSRNVQPGFITNDPYIKLDKLPPEVDFPLNTVSYYWVYANRTNQEEIAIFVAPKVYDKAMFSELKKNDQNYETIARDIAKQFRTESGQEIDTQEIKEVLEKLNPELVIPSIDLIRANISNKTDNIEPIKYKYKIITDPAEFEEKLYITIEDNISKRYKYKLVENVLEDLTTIGNKLEYTDERGQLVRKQSIADFNANAPAVIIRRETFIDITRIPDLLGYIYEDMKYYGTDALPVPNIEIDFYFPRPGADRNSAAMFNGTSLEFNIDSISKRNFFNSDGGNDNSGAFVSGGAVLPGSTTVTVRYINSKGEILKENRVGNLFPKSTYLPEIIPVINDKEGKEWTIEESTVKPFIINEDASQNVIELKYKEIFAHVNISFINREGKKIAEDKQELVQAGTTYDFSQKMSFVDQAGDEWKLLSSRPSKLLVREETEKNNLILVYDVERAEVVVRFLNKGGEPIAEEKSQQVCIEKMFTPEEIPPYIVDKEGLGWNYMESSTSSIMVKKDTLNIIELMYEEAKKRVITRIRNEEGLNIADEKVEFVQIGRTYSADFDESVTDFECKEWTIKEIVKREIVVGTEDKDNILEAVYSPRLANVTIMYYNTDDRQIKELSIEKGQIGGVYNTSAKDEIVDNFGYSWKCVDRGNKLVVSEKETQNRITLKYEPLMSKVTIKYFDSEMNELTDTKYETLQVGTSYKNSPAKKFTDAKGRKWVIDESKVPTITVKKYEEENIVPIYYDKELAKVNLTFYNTFGEKLRDPLEVESQIGAQLDYNLYSRVTDYNGGRWSFEDSEPKNLTVKEIGNSFKLLYGELKAKILVKHINVETQKTIVDDIISSVRLGNIFAAPIRPKILDKNKCQWKYIGDDNITIVTKENEQENIIILNYEEDKAKVILKYRDKDDNKIREDAIKEVQIGKEIKLEPIEKFNDNEGLGWKYSKSSFDNKVIKEGENVIMNYYVPLESTVTTKYLNEEGQVIYNAKIESIQVGRKFSPELLDIVKDGKGASWKYVSTSAEEIIVKEEPNEVELKYTKYLSEIKINLLDVSGNPIAEPILVKEQVGTTYQFAYEERFIDSEDKSWLFDSIDLNKIKVAEDTTKNVINVKYKKELTDVKLCFINPGLIPVKDPQIVRAQIGSIYIAEPPREIIDNKMLGWEVDEKSIPKYKVKRDASENIININYNKFLVDVTVKFYSDKDEMVIADNVTKHQVGTSFMPTIEDYINDEEGKEWIHELKLANKFFSSGKKVEPITVSKIPEKNVIKLIYKPSMTKVTVRYNDPLGNEIKSSIETEAQIGSNYTPQIIEKIVGAGNIKWMYNPNSKSTIKINQDSTKNVVNLAYEEEKSLVIYKYIDEDNNTLKEDKKVLIQIGSTYRVEAENVIEDEEGKVWEYKAKDRDQLIVAEDDSKNIITVKYIPLKVDVELSFITLNGNQIMKNKIVKAQLGSTFKPDIDATISDEESKLFKFVKCEPENIKVKEVPVGLNSNNPVNFFKLTYQAVFSEARIIFKDVDGNRLKDDEVKQMQVGLVFAPSPVRYVTDKKGIQWELIDDNIESLRVKENPKENEISMTYEVAKAEISVRYKDLDGNIIKEATILHLDIGSEFIPEVQNEIVDSSNRKWIYNMTDPVKLTVGSINNIINVIYQEKKVNTVVKIQTTEGKTLKDDIRTKQQVGSKFSPQPKQKVIYDNNNDIWRFAYNNPSDIIISENPEENVIIQYYTNDSAVKTTNETKGYFNAEAQKFIDKDLVEAAQKEEEEKQKQKLEEEQKKAEEQKTMAANEVKFTDEHLLKLEKNIKLSNEEKATINTLNDYNTQIVTILRDALAYNGDLNTFNLSEKLNEVIRKEKKLAEEGLSNIIAEDKTGNKISQIFEAITMSEMYDKNFNILQQKKSIQFADYFVNLNVTDRDQATYIIDRGKATEGLKIVNAKIANSKTRDEELIKIKVILTYQLAMLDNYYRARSIVLDEYFTSEESKQKVPREVIVLVANTMPTQALKIFNKIQTITPTDQNELESILKLLSPQQLETITNGINKIQDGKTRKMSLKMFKEITGLK